MDVGHTIAKKSRILIKKENVDGFERERMKLGYGP